MIAASRTSGRAPIPCAFRATPRCTRVLTALAAEEQNSPACRRRTGTYRKYSRKLPFGCDCEDCTERVGARRTVLCSDSRRVAVDVGERVHDGTVGLCTAFAFEQALGYCRENSRSMGF